MQLGNLQVCGTKCFHFNSMEISRFSGSGSLNSRFIYKRREKSVDVLREFKGLALVMIK